MKNTSLFTSIKAIFLALIIGISNSGIISANNTFPNFALDTPAEGNDKDISKNNSTDINEMDIDTSMSTENNNTSIETDTPIESTDTSVDAEVSTESTETDADLDTFTANTASAAVGETKIINTHAGVPVPKDAVISITINGDSLKDVKKDSTVNNWFGSTIPNGITAKILEINSSKTVVNIKFTGDPWTAFDKEMRITIPSANLVSNKSLSVDTKGSKFIIPELSSIESKAIHGSLGRPLGDDATTRVTLTHGTFENLRVGSDISNWFTHYTLDIKVRAVVGGFENNNKTIIIKFVGTPIATSDRLLRITIPSEFTSLSVMIHVPKNYQARFAINVHFAVLGDSNIKGVVNTPLGDDAIIKLDLYHDSIRNISNLPADITSWFIKNSLPTGVRAKIINIVDSRLLTIKLEGSPQNATSNIFSILIPSLYLSSNMQAGLYPRVNENCKITIFNSAAILENKTIDGNVGLSFDSDSDAIIKVTLLNNKFKDLNVNDDITSWFGTGENKILPNGITAKVSAFESENTVLSIKLNGTPTKVFEKVLSITIPAEKLASHNTALTSSPNNQVKLIIKSSSAILESGKTINHFTGEELPFGTTLNLKLLNDTFKNLNINDDITSWFGTGSKKTLPDGVVATVSQKTGNDKITIKFTGVPTLAFNKTLVITIPAGNLTISTTNVDVNTKSSKFVIAGPYASLTYKNVTGSANTALSADSTITLTLTNDKFKDLNTTGSSPTNLTSWFESLPDNVTATASSLDKLNKVLTIKFSGTPKKNFEEYIKITIPAKNLVTCSTPLSVDNKKSKFIINGPVAKLESIYISGTVGILVNADITLNLQNDTFKDLTTSTDISDWFIENSLPSTINATVKSITSSKLVINLKGIPLEASTNIPKLKIPKKYLTNSIIPLNSELNKDCKLTINPGSTRVNLSDKTISGIVGSNLSEDSSIQLILFNDTFTSLNTTSGSETNVSNWFIFDSIITLPEGVTAVASIT